MLRHPSYRTEPERHSAWPRPKSDGPMRILVIEDDKKTADYILKGLAECGYTADWAADGPDGLHRATSRRYAALVVDRMLPRLAALAHVKALPAAELPGPLLLPRPLPHVAPRGPN